MKRLLLLLMVIFCCCATAFADEQKTTHKKHHVHAKKTHKKASHHARVYHPQYAAPAPNQLAMAMPGSSKSFSFFSSPSFVASMEEKLVKFVRGTVANLSYSVYKLGGKQFELSRGVYVLDCSEYIDNILHHVYPKAYSKLVDSSGTETPTSQHYYEFFNELSDNEVYEGWTKISDVDQLQAGDVLVFRNKGMHRGANGHVMIVMDKPISDDDAYLVRVADSAPSGHSQDTRQPNTSGIGIGTLLLKTDPVSGKPSAYAWKVGSPWKYNVKFAMARPMYS